MQKLTLSVAPHVIERAKRQAASQRTSVSRLVEAYLELLSDGAPAGGPGATPVLARLRGSLKRTRPEDYGRYLEKKYR